MSSRGEAEKDSRTNFDSGFKGKVCTQQLRLGGSDWEEERV